MDKINLNTGKILVTGGMGYLGQQLIRNLVNEKASISSIDISKENTVPDIDYFNIDLRESETLSKVIDEIHPDIVYHLAANIDRTRDFNKTNEIFSVNFNGTINLLNALKNVNYSNFIYTSTSEVYGGNVIVPPFNETDNFTPASPYSLSKYCAEVAIKTFSELYKKNYTILRLFNFYGSKMPSDFFLPQLINSLRRNVEFEMTGGEQIRDFLHVNDIIKALILATNEKAHNEVFNVCSGKGISIKELALYIKKILKSKSKINFGAHTYRDNEVWKMIGDNSKIISTLNYSFEDFFIALKDCIYNE